VTTDFSGAESYDKALAMTVARDNRIVLVGVSRSDDDFDFAVARYLTDGSLDPSFGAGGLVTTHLSGPGGEDEARAVAIQSDGRIIVAGESDNHLALARYTTDGNLDPSFGIGGLVTSDWSGGAEAMVVDSNDSFVVLFGSKDGVFALARFSAR
jgi:uncharacterized delta-60 repeat protein